MLSTHRPKEWSTKNYPALINSACWGKSLGSQWAALDGEAWLWWLSCLHTELIQYSGMVLAYLPHKGPRNNQQKINLHKSSVHVTMWFCGSVEHLKHSSSCSWTGKYGFLKSRWELKMINLYKKTSFPGVSENHAVSWSQSKLVVMQCPMLTTSLGILINSYHKDCQQFNDTWADRMKAVWAPSLASLQSSYMNVSMPVGDTAWRGRHEKPLWRQSMLNWVDVSHPIWYTICSEWSKWSILHSLRQWVIDHRRQQFWAFRVRSLVTLHSFLGHYFQHISSWTQ